MKHIDFLCQYAKLNLEMVFGLLMPFLEHHLQAKLSLCHPLTIQLFVWSTDL